MNSKLTIDNRRARYNTKHFDLIIIGGGIYGVMLAVEAVQRHLKPLILEKGDFGGGSSLQHLRTLHGGFRYLQSLDLKRFFESVKERKWFLQHFPHYTGPLPCLMPLYGQGIYRRPVFRAGLLLNDLLSWNRNRGIPSSHHLGRGRVLNADETLRCFPGVRREGLKGAALWFDGAMPDHHRIFFDLLLNACGEGATALNYTHVRRLMVKGNRVTGVEAVGGSSEVALRFYAPLVFNAAGPACRTLAREFDRDYPQLFKQPLRLWNILFKREALSGYALALMPRRNSGHTYFVHNWKGRMLAGTGEVTLSDREDRVIPAAQEIRDFLKDLNQAVPGLNLTEDDVEHVYAGILPGNGGGGLAKREVILDHGKLGGPAGLWSISGVKFTTARRVADKVINRVFALPKQEIRFRNSRRGTYPYHWEPLDDRDEWLASLRDIHREEAVQQPGDLLYRRTDLGENTRRLDSVLPDVLSLIKKE